MMGVKRREVQVSKEREISRKGDEKRKGGGGGGFWYNFPHYARKIINV